MILAVSMFVGYNSGDRESFKQFSNTSPEVVPEFYPRIGSRSGSSTFIHFTVKSSVPKVVPMVEPCFFAHHPFRNPFFAGHGLCQRLTPGTSGHQVYPNSAQAVSCVELWRGFSSLRFETRSLQVASNMALSPRSDR